MNILLKYLLYKTKEAAKESHINMSGQMKHIFWYEKTINSEYFAFKKYMTIILKCCNINFLPVTMSIM